MESTEIIDRLKKWGCDTEGALERVGQDKDFLVSLITEHKNLFDFTELREQIVEGDVKKAFETSHALKGMFGNLGITPLYELSKKINEPLRGGDSEGLLPLVDEAIDKTAELCHLIEE